ncbi:MAG TPA: PAS domain S-box protein [Magnetospirillaceae bacterium]|jgi:PAS domain S-box-containing protein
MNQGLTSTLLAQDGLKSTPVDEDAVSDDRFRNVFEVAAAGMALVAFDGSILQVNGAFTALFGYATDEVVGTKFEALAGASLPTNLVGQLSDVIEGLQASAGFELGYIHRARGQLIWAQTSISLLQESGKPCCYLYQFRDLTERHKTTAELLRQEALYKATYQQAPVGIAFIDRDYKYVHVNETLAMYLGYKAGDLVGRVVPDVVPDIWPQVEPKMRAALVGGEAIRNFEVVGNTPTQFGSPRQELISYQPVRIFGEIVGLSMTVIDITERRTAEAALRRNREHFALVQSVGRIGSTEVNLKTREAFWSDEIYDLLGLDRDSVKPGVESFVITVHPDDRAQLLESSLRSRRGEETEPCEFRVLRPDGSIRWLYRQSTFLYDDTGMPSSVVTTIFETTERKTSEVELRHQREHLAFAQRLGGVGSCEINLKTHEIFWSEETYNLFGRGLDLPPAKYDEFLSLIHPDDRQRVAEAVHTTQQTLNGDEIEFRIIRQDGAITWLNRKVELVRDADGSPMTLFILNKDITAAKAVEQRRAELEEQLRQSQKIEAVGRLTGGVAHDFNNLLTIILGNIELAEDVAEENTEIRQFLDAARSAGTRGADLIHRLLAFSRQQPLEPVSSDINQMVHGMAPLLRRTLGETIKIELHLAVSIRNVIIDPNQFESALLNLAVNSRDAMPDGGALHIESKAFDVDEAYAASRPGLAPGSYVCVSVSDTGTGMSPGVIERAFEPFFTTKDVGKGTGLGLSMIYGFVKQSGGHITIESEVGVGTTISMLLPSSEDAIVEPIVAPARPAATAPVTETILMVEDDFHVREVTQTFLERLGYRVIEAGSVDQALKQLSAHRDITLLLTDLILPGGGDGGVLAKAAKALRPNLKVLFMSGYTEDVLMENGRLEKGVTLLRKPFTRNALADGIRSLLTSPPI